MPSQTHYDIAQILHLKGVGNVVLSPGSRCAPLTLAAVRHPKLKTFTISDERSAAFIALGMSERLNEAVALICTSGTAALNYYPAITEAFYRGIPLIVITADRPPELIDQWDGQTIRQSNVYSNHILSSVDLPADLDIEENSHYAIRLINESINRSIHEAGPVHINVPLKEPLYPEKEKGIKFSKDLILPDINKTHNYHFGATELKKQMNSFRRMMIVVGQMPHNKDLNKILSEISGDEDAVIIGDHLANLHSKNTFITGHDFFLGKAGIANSLPKPDLLITLGRSVLSKSLKTYLRKLKKLEHWQIGLYDEHDTYGKLKKSVKVPEIRFLQSVQSFFESDKDFYRAWKEQNQKSLNERDEYLKKADFSEISAIEKIMDKIPAGSDLHLSNSLATRYVNLFQDKIKRRTGVFCNRGTSGIDGCTSTAVGHALSSDRLQVLITGDLAFFYDRNALWHNYDLNNLRIILLNNHGGGIFRVIKGPREQAELEEYFETAQKLNAEHTALDFNIDYHRVSDFEGLKSVLNSFFSKNSRFSLLEIESKAKKNESHYRHLMYK